MASRGGLLPVCSAPDGVHVVQLLALFLGSPDVEIVEAGLPELLGDASRLPL
jgi:hypothetical protein